MIDIDKLIMGAVKDRDKVSAQVYKNIKAKILEYKTAKGAKPYDDVAEISLLNKMYKELNADKEIFDTNGRTDLAESTAKEMSVIEKLLPKPASEEDIEEQINLWISINGNIDKKQMGLVIKDIKSKFPSADGKTVSELVRKHIS